jgi:hypothetical protein
MDIMLQSYLNYNKLGLIVSILVLPEYIINFFLKNVSLLELFLLIEKVIVAISIIYFLFNIFLLLTSEREELKPLFILFLAGICNILIALACVFFTEKPIILYVLVMQLFIFFITDRNIGLE